jgi:hypothetical protein
MPSGGPLLCKDQVIGWLTHYSDGSVTMSKIERKKELDRRRKRKHERQRGKTKLLRAQWEKKKQEKMQEKVIIKKAAEKPPSPEEST